MNNRITAIIGAGAPMDFSYDKSMIKPSTTNITKKITERYNVRDINNGKSRESDLVNKIYQRLKRHYPAKENWKEKKNEKNINFEMLFHVLESLYAYNPVWTKKCNNPEMYPLYAPFVKPCIKKDLDYISQIFPVFTIRIMDIINSYNQYFIKNKNKTEKWYYDFFSKKSIKWDVFNLNYDTTIENCIKNYQDGFEKINGYDFMRFNPKALWQAKKSTINHLHGCINYYFDSYKNPNYDCFNRDFHDLYKYSNYEKVKQMLEGRGYSNPSTQTGENYYISPIITGLRKTDKITNFPLDFYYGKLCDTIVKNHSMLIIGYSFGDLYINNLIERMFAIHGDKARIVLIDYWDENKIASQGFEHYCEYCLPSNEMSVIVKAAQQNVYNASTSLKEQYGNNYLFSKNGRLMLFINGFKQASNFADDIFSFLGNSE